MSVPPRCSGWTNANGVSARWEAHRTSGTPATTEADVDKHTEVLEAAVKALFG